MWLCDIEEQHKIGMFLENCRVVSWAFLRSICGSATEACGEVSNDSRMIPKNSRLQLVPVDELIEKMMIEWK